MHLYTVQVFNDLTTSYYQVSCTTLPITYIHIYMHVCTCTCIYTVPTQPAELPLCIAQVVECQSMNLVHQDLSKAAPMIS